MQVSEDVHGDVVVQMIEEYQVMQPDEAQAVMVDEQVLEKEVTGFLWQLRKPLNAAS